MSGPGFWRSIGRRMEKVSGQAQCYEEKRERLSASICGEMSGRCCKERSRISDGQFLRATENIWRCGNRPAHQMRGCWKDFRKESRQTRLLMGNISVRVIPCPSVT